MFKAMAKLNLGASVVKHRRAGSGTGGSRHGSAEDLSRAFEETSVSASPDLADVPRSLEAWAEQDSDDFDADAFAAEHYGDAGERRVARLHAVLSALQTEAGDKMKRNVLDHHAAFVEVAREISRLTETARALRDLAAIPSDAVDALLADAEADAARRSARRTRATANEREDDVFFSETRRGLDGVRVSDAAAAARLARELETLVERRAPHAALDAARRAAFFAETVTVSARASKNAETSSSRAETAEKHSAAGTAETAETRAAFDGDESRPAAARALLAAAASARRAAAAMLAEIARGSDDGGGVAFVEARSVAQTGVGEKEARSAHSSSRGGREEDASRRAVARRAASVFVLARLDASGAESARRACVARAVASSRAARADVERAERTLSIETLSRESNKRNRDRPGVASTGPAYALAACEAFFGGAHALAAELAAVDDAAETSAASATARLWSATATAAPFARDEADAFADALAARCLAFPASVATLDLFTFDKETKDKVADARARRVLADSRLALSAFFAHADAFAESAPAYLGVAARRRVCARAAVKKRLEKLLFETTAANALDARAEDLLRAYLNGAGDDAADALRAFAVLS